MAKRKMEKQPSDFPTPGLLSLRSLAINKGFLTPQETNVTQRTIGDQQMLLNRELKGRQFQNAARNVVGLMLYRIGREDEAIAQFKETLKEDEFNLNAIQDLLTIYRDCKSSDEVEKYMELLQQARKRVQSGTAEESIMYARCKIEQAYAMFCDLQTKCWDSSERSEQVMAFENAIALGRLQKKFLCSEEISDWYYYTGLANKKLAYAQFREDASSEYDKSIVVAYIYLWSCLRQSSNKMHRAKVYCALGDIFTFIRSIHLDLPTHSHEMLHILDIPGLMLPDETYKKALEIDPDNAAWIWTRLGLSYLRRKQLDKARDAFTQSIEPADQLHSEDPTKMACRLAYHERARTFIQQAKQATEKGTQRNLLLRAKNDSETACQNDNHPKVLATAGEVHYRLVRLDDDDQHKESLLATALRYFKAASSSPEGQFISDMHFKYAWCLQEKGDFHLAIASYKVAFNNAMASRSDSYKGVVARDLLKSMFLNFNEEKPNIYIEFAYWLEQIFTTLEDVEVKKTVKHLINRKLTKELEAILSFVIMTAASSHEKMIISYLSYFAPNSRKLERVFKQQMKIHKNKPELFNMRNLMCPPDVEKAINDGFKYDFYIVSDEEDSEVDNWVRDKLLPGLENPLYCLKGCYPKRDVKLGELKKEEQAKAIKDSAFVLIVISEEFEENQDCMTLARMACECKSQDTVRLAALLRDTVPLPTFLCQYRSFDFRAQLNPHYLAGYLLPKVITGVLP